MRAGLVLDSSVVLAAADAAEPEHGDALACLERVRAAQAGNSVQLFAPPELWLEVEVVLRRKKSDARPLDGLAITMVPLDGPESVTAFLDVVEARSRGKSLTANATDLTYLWVAWREGATLTTLDRGILKYHGVVCDVMRPFHVRF